MGLKTFVNLMNISKRKFYNDSNEDDVQYPENSQWLLFFSERMKIEKN